MQSFWYFSSDKISKGTFDERDVERVKTDDAYCRCFLRTLKSKGNVDKALDVMDNALKFRKENEINGKLCNDRCTECHFICRQDKS